MPTPSEMNLTIEHFLKRVLLIFWPALDPEKLLEQALSYLVKIDGGYTYDHFTILANHLKYQKTYFGSNKKKEETEQFIIAGLTDAARKKNLKTVNPIKVSIIASTTERGVKIIPRVTKKITQEEETILKTQTPVLKVQYTQTGIEHRWNLEYGKSYSVGRLFENDIHINQKNISRSHLVLEITSDGLFFITDQNSSNGTAINNQWLRGGERTPIKVGDKVQLAKESPVILTIEMQ